MARLYHKANNQYLFSNADTSYRRLMGFTEEQIEKYEKLIEEIPPFMRLIHFMVQPLRRLLTKTYNYGRNKCRI